MGDSKPPSSPATPAAPDSSASSLGQPSAGDVTLLLARIGQGDRAASDQLFQVLYADMRALAGKMFQHQRADQTLQPTALVHDAYLRLARADNPAPQWHDRAHFFATAALAMRQVLADHARRKRADKRGGEWQRVTLDEGLAAEAGRSHDIIDLDEALTRLAELDERKARVVELRFFGGLGLEEIADVLKLSRATIVDDWAVARAWLKSEMTRGDLA